jgi:hypothetical protein
MYPQHRQLGLNLTQRQPQKKMIVLETVESVLGLVVPNMVMLKSGNVELRNLHPCPVKIIVIHSRPPTAKCDLFFYRKTSIKKSSKGYNRC